MRKRRLSEKEALTSPVGRLWKREEAPTSRAGRLWKRLERPTENVLRERLAHLLCSSSRHIRVRYAMKAVFPYLESALASVDTQPKGSRIFRTLFLSYNSYGKAYMKLCCGSLNARSVGQFCLWSHEQADTHAQTPSLPAL